MPGDNHLQAKAASARRRNARTTALDPLQIKKVRSHLPRNGDPTRYRRKGAMLGGVGGKFVQRQCNPLRHVRKEAKARQDLLAREVRSPRSQRAAVVQTVVRLTRAKNVAEFRDAFKAHGPRCSYTECSTIYPPKSSACWPA